MNKFSVEKIMRVYNDNKGIYLQISQNPDFPDSGLVISTANNPENEAWYGKVELNLNSREEVLALVMALNEMAAQIK